VFGGERRGGEGEGVGRGIEWISVRWNGLVVMEALEVTDVGGKFHRIKIIHALIKTGMECNLNVVGIWIIPQDVFLSMGEITKEDAFARVVLETTLAFTRGADPDASAKGT
jgi:hypothetical protein